MAGCAGDEGITRGGSVMGATLTVYSVEPDPSRGESLDLVQGEKLALADARGTAGAFTVNFSSLDGAGSRAAEAAAVRRAIADPQVIAVIARATRVSVPLLNAAGVLQVAEGGDAALAGDPRLEPSGRPTLARAPAPAVPPDFRARFTRAFGRDPGPGAARGYAAMREVLAAVRAARGRGNDRTVVIDAYRRG